MPRRIIKIIDLFSGPGGLGEGFSAFTAGVGDFHPFRIGASAEMDPAASRTLRLRSFFRKALLKAQAPQSYYDYIAGLHDQPFDNATKRIWEEACEETGPVELGSPEGDREIDRRIGRMELTAKSPAILIGGPPCQAYSLVGRARNKGVSGYVPEKDHRHFLYQDYLRILAENRPAVFVMENVKGILSSKVAGERIFHSILEDLAAPEFAIWGGSGRKGIKYRLYSLVTGDHFEKGDDPEEFDSRNFVVRAEDFGIPQKRHRVFILGVREDIDAVPRQLQPGKEITCGDVISDLPWLRSGLSKITDSPEAWIRAIRTEGKVLVKNLRNLGSPELARIISANIKEIGSLGPDLERAAFSASHAELKRLGYGRGLGREFRGWFLDKKLRSIPNHETRGHIAGDLGRYLFCSSFGELCDRSPKASDFPDCLAPSHANWKSGKFSDRFRVQLQDEPGTTVTSHISKDGHYFIHYDPVQCRSLTVREAARIQTFPDNYFFEGNRTQQYGQVGNAVPPLLARQIAEIIYNLLK